MKNQMSILTIVFVALFVTAGDAEAAKKKIVPDLPPPIVAITPDLQLSQAVVERDGTLKILNTMTCDASPSSVCQKECGSTSCEWAEPPCRDCLGTGSEVLREVFTKLSTTYKATEPIDNTTLVRTLVKHTIALSPQSPYDYFNSSQDPGLAAQLQSMCGSTTGFVGVMYDEASRPTRALLVVCNTPEGVRAKVLERIDDTNLEFRLDLLKR